MASGSSSKLKTSLRKQRVLAPLHTGGPVAISFDGRYTVTCVGTEVKVTRVEDGVQICAFAVDDETIHSICVTPSFSFLVVFSASLAMHIYEIPKEPQERPLRSVHSIARAHEAPVHVCRADPTSTYLASGSADGVVKVWNISLGQVTHVFKGHGGVVSALCFSYNSQGSSLASGNSMKLITASVDTKLRVFNLSASSHLSRNGRPDAILDGHMSVPRGIDVTPDGSWIVSGGRDSVVHLWNMSASNPASKKGKERMAEALVVQPSRTIPVLERIEAVGILRSHASSLFQGTDCLPLFTAGEKGDIKIWDGTSGKRLFTMGDVQNADSDDSEEHEIVDAFYIEATSSIVSVHANQNIIFHSITSQNAERQLVGYNDEIIDICILGVEDSHLAVAANSRLIRVYSMERNDAKLLSGHANVVLALDRSARRDVLVSGSKDNSARLWAFRPETSNWICIALCEGHAESVGAVAMSRKSSPDHGFGLKFLFTGSRDRTIKMWNLAALPEDAPADPIRCKSLTTHKAHDKDINSLDVAPNDILLASGSQDRTIKIFEIEYSGAGGSARGEIKLLGTCKGHKRGVWTVRFGRTERVLASGSGDKTIKLWNIDDFTCLKTFEGHTNSVLRVDFISAGAQLISSASDGLLKLWNTRTEECVATMDNHEDKIWGLAQTSDEELVLTGGADSTITFWKDDTEEREKEKEELRADSALKQQDFLNYLSLKDYKNAISLALVMNQPGRLLKLFKEIISSSLNTLSDESGTRPITGAAAVDIVLKNLGSLELVRLMEYVRDWNTRASTSPVAQVVLYAILKLRSAQDILGALNGTVNLPESQDAPKPKKEVASVRSIAQSLLPYTERHLARMDRLLQESYVIDYVLGEMDDGMFGQDVPMELVQES